MLKSFSDCVDNEFHDYLLRGSYNVDKEKANQKLNTLTMNFYILKSEILILTCTCLFCL